MNTYLKVKHALRSLLPMMMLLPLMGHAQMNNTVENAAVDTAMVGRQWGADSTVLVVPYRQLVLSRLDALVYDSLMETTQLGLMVWDLTADSMLYAHHPRHLMRTASTMKLLTAITALDVLGVSYQYNTSLYYKGKIEQGQLRGDLICRGGMDPMFGRGDMQTFARELKKKGVKSIRGRLVTDCSMKDAEKWGEGWCWDDDNPTLSPLLCEGKPDFASQLLRELRSAGIATNGVTIVGGSLPADAKLVCTRSHGIDEVLQQMMKESDNLYAEATYYQVAASTGSRPATAKDARKVEMQLLERAGLQGDQYRLADGSGLSLYNYLSAEAQVMLLRYVWQHPQIYNHLLPSLPIAGVDGTLKKRMLETTAQGNVQAKTGTVTGVSALAGYLTAPNGHRLCFSIINQGIKRAAEGRDFQDRVCQALCMP